MIGLWLLTWAPALAAELPSEPIERRRSPGLTVATGVGLTLGTLGAVGMVVSAPDLTADGCFECFVGSVVLPPSSVALGVGTALALGSSWVQARRIGANPELALAGTLLFGAGGVLASVGGATGNLELAVFGGGGFAVTGLLLAAGQGGANRRHDRLSLAVVPRFGRETGLTLVFFG